MVFSKFVGCTDLKELAQIVRHFSFLFIAEGTFRKMRRPVIQVVLLQVAARLVGEAVPLDAEQIFSRRFLRFFLFLFSRKTLVEFASCILHLLFL
jgi:hypothetical protein